jgi:hypothetical protein
MGQIQVSKHSVLTNYPKIEKSRSTDKPSITHISGTNYIKMEVNENMILLFTNWGEPILTPI